MGVMCPCGNALPARRRTYCSQTCSERYRKRRQRGGATRPIELYTRAVALEDIAAACELLPADIALLEKHYPENEDEEMDELIAGLLAHVASLERLQAWLAGGES